MVSTWLLIQGSFQIVLDSPSAHQVFFRQFLYIVLDNFSFQREKVLESKREGTGLTVVASIKIVLVVFDSCYVLLLIAGIFQQYLVVFIVFFIKNYYERMYCHRYDIAHSRQFARGTLVFSIFFQKLVTHLSILVFFSLFWQCLVALKLVFSSLKLRLMIGRMGLLQLCTVSNVINQRKKESEDYQILFTLKFVGHYCFMENIISKILLIIFIILGYLVSYFINLLAQELLVMECYPIKSHLCSFLLLH